MKISCWTEQARRWWSNFPRAVRLDNVLPSHPSLLLAQGSFSHFDKFLKERNSQLFENKINGWFLHTVVIVTNISKQVKIRLTFKRSCIAWQSKQKLQKNYTLILAAYARLWHMPFSWVTNMWHPAAPAFTHRGWGMMECVCWWQ